LVNRIVQHIDVSKKFELEEFLNNFYLLDVVAAQVYVLEGWQVWHIFFRNLVYLVLAQVQFAKIRQVFPASDGRDQVLSHVELLELGHRLEGCKSLELVVNALDDSKTLVASPTLVNFFKLVVTDVKVLKLRTLDRGKIAKLVVRNV
jgi:hypothetical protein